MLKDNDKPDSPQQERIAQDNNNNIIPTSLPPPTQITDINNNNNTNNISGPQSPVITSPQPSTSNALALRPRETRYIPSITADDSNYDNANNSPLEEELGQDSKALIMSLLKQVLS